jgi:thiaminase/transcriptional activator TenA
MTVTQQLREQTSDLWQSVLMHPFVRGIGDGSLDAPRFRFYLEQDYVYLIEFSRLLAIAAAKSETLADMNQFADLLQSTLATEMDLHRRTCLDYGVDEQTLAKTEPAWITVAYTNMLLRTCYEGSFADILTALLPCAAGYVEIAEHLRAEGLPDHRHYRDWIETYTTPEMKSVVLWIQGRLDELTTVNDTDHARRFRIYRDSARFELLFFEMAWQQSSWPPVVPV